jgi:hypothetical protein
MSWVRFDDQFYADEDLDEICDSATALHVVATTWSAMRRTNGRVPYKRAAMLKGGDNPDAVPDLLRIGWWIDTGECYQIRSFLKYNPSSDELARRELELSQKRSDAGKRGAESRWQNGKQHGNIDGNGDSNGDSNDHGKKMPPVPVPVPVSDSGPDSVPEPPVVERADASTPPRETAGLPKRVAKYFGGLARTDEYQDCFRRQTPAQMADSFVNHWEGVNWIRRGAPIANWPAAAREWAANERKFANASDSDDSRFSGGLDDQAREYAIMAGEVLRGMGQ